MPVADQRSVSPVIGVILIVAIVIILAAIGAGFLLDFSSETPEETPITAVQFEWEQEEGTAIISHVGGEAIDIDNLRLEGPGELVFPGEEVTAGDTLTIDIHEPDGELQLIYTGGDQHTVLATGENPVTAHLDFPPEITVAYEDLEVHESDFDYGDWVVELQTQIQGFVAHDDSYAEEVTIHFEPRARYAGYDHDQYIVPANLGSGEYELERYDADGNVIETDAETFSASDQLFILNSASTLGSMADCDPAMTAEITLDLDSPARIPDDPINETHQHGSGLPFEPVMVPTQTGEVIGPGDARLLTVQMGWEWPDDGTHIATVYDNVGPADPDDLGDPPTFQERTWFETPSDPSALNSC